jgi:hypothetical protein
METRGFFIALMMISNPQSISAFSALTFAFFAINFLKMQRENKVGHFFFLDAEKPHSAERAKTK